MQNPFALKPSLLAASSLLLTLIPLTHVQANTTAVSGTINKVATGTTFDTWHIHMLNAGSLSIDLLGYEANAAGVTADLNGDGELTFLDPETNFYKDTGNPLAAADFLARCDDVNNNCPTVNNATLTLTDSYITTGNPIGSADGSLHKRDPFFTVTLAAGDYLYLVADYRLTPAEAVSGINGGDTFSTPSGFVNPIVDHADYRITLSSATMNIAANGQNITVSSVPLPAAVWLFVSALAGFGLFGRKKTGLIA